MMAGRCFADVLASINGVSALHGTVKAPSSPTDLAVRASFALGTATVSPSTCAISGPAGSATVEPRVMQVLVALADAHGRVVTRSALVDDCWNGRFVGDDAVNRAIMEVRRALRSVAPDSIALTTIPKVGWQLIGDAPVAVNGCADAPMSAEAPSDPARSGTTRRRVLTGGALLAAAAAGGVALWRSRPDPSATRVALLVERSQVALREAVPGGAQQAVALLKEAQAIAPADVGVRGKLALAWAQAAEEAGPAAAAAAVAACQQTAQDTLQADPRQPDALAALATVMPIYGDWLAAEKRLRSVLAVDAGHEVTTAALGVLLMSTGRVAVAAATSATLLEQFPLSPVYHYRRTYHLWTLGKLGDMDRVADRALELWPRHVGVWMARMWTLGYTGRGNQALALIRDIDARPPLPPPFVDMLTATMMALATGAPTDIAQAIAVNRAVGERGPTFAVATIQHLSALGAIDAAFDLANAYLLRGGPLSVNLRHTAAEPSINDQRHRKTMMLWLPATRALRADARFLLLCRDMGMTRYWQAAGVKPDYLGRSPLPV